ncbi:MAG: hypothetical protein ABI112_09720 [Terracoccus sp.]
MAGLDEYSKAVEVQIAIAGAAFRRLLFVMAWIGVVLGVGAVVTVLISSGEEKALMVALIIAGGITGALFANN